jgi:hypothetical protein
MQEDGHRSDGDVREKQRVQNNLPPGRIHQTIDAPLQQGVVERKIKHLENLSTGAGL